MEPEQQQTAADRLTALLRLKRHETPGEDYFDSLLPRFHARQRAEMLRGSSLRLLGERVGVFLDNLWGGRWVAGGLAAYASVLLGAVVLLQWSSSPPGPSSQVLQPVSLQPAGPSQILPVEVRITPVRPLPKTPTPPAP
jgi:hypothetical protein